MPDEDEQDFDLRPGVGEIWSLLEILNIATSTSNLQNWLENRGIPDDPEFRIGYLLFLETGLRSFIILSENNSTVELNTDYQTERALAQLAELSNIPHSTEKLAFYRNLNRIQNDLRNLSPASDDFYHSVQCSMEPVTSALEETREVVEPAEDCNDLEEATRDAIALSLYMRFQSTDRNRPRGYGPINLHPWLTGGPRDNSIDGYARTLQFIWSGLVSDEEYERAGIAELHEAERWSARDYFELSELGLEEEPRTCLSEFSTQIREELISPIDEKYHHLTKGGLGSLTPDDLVSSEEISLRNTFSHLLAEQPPRDVSELDPADRVAYGLLWFEQAEWLGSGTFSKIPLLETTLWGLVRVYGRFDEEIPIHVTRFSHPVDGQGSRVSYAILQRVPRGMLGDPSGWLIFNHCAADYGVEGQAKLERIEGMLDVVAKRNPVTRIELDVSRDHFEKEAAKRLSDDYLETQIENTTLLSAIRDSRGIIVELATVYSVHRLNPDWRISWAEKMDGEEFDVLVDAGDSTRVLECKADIDSAGVEKSLNQLSRKVSSIDEDAIGEIWVWSRPSDSAVQAVDAAGFDIICLQDLDPIVQASNDELEEIFSEFIAELEERHPLAPEVRFRSEKY